MRSSFLRHWFVFGLACASVCLFAPCRLSAQSAPSRATEFEKVIAPFVAKHCVVCHGPEKKKADLVLHVYKDEKSLLKDRKIWHNVVDAVHAGEMPPSGKPRPALADSEAFLKAVNGIFDRADRTARLDPGRVTMRRLNRAEYNNTIRDLLGVDFQPAADFPSDDVGFGFDNIGDVLTLSPLLMERYLVAAEAIARRTIVAEDTPRAPPGRSRSARYLEPSLQKPSEKIRFRPLISGNDSLFASFELTQEGDYKARVLAHAQQAGDEPVKFALLLNDKLLKTFTIRGDDKKAQTFEVPVDLPAASARLAVKLLNPHKDPKQSDQARTLQVHSLHLDGPISLPASHRKLMVHAPGLDKREAAREILTRFATRAYRRPAARDEIERMLQLFDQSTKDGDSFESSIRLAVQAVLVSPKFLFRVELDQRPDSAAAHPIDDYQLASRLSYFLWSTMPDDELFALAAKNQLHANLDSQVQRMLKDARSRALVENFAMQWLQLRIMKNFSPDTKTFPEFDDRLRSAMLKETELFVDAVLREDRSILELLDARFTFLNERLARHYGIADTNGNPRDKKAITTPGQPIRGDGFVRVALASGDRGGLLGQASILAVTSNPTRTSPVKRGRYVLEQILGTPPPPPPPDVPALAEGDKVQTKGSLRQRMEQHRSNPACANCHARLDPLGFGLENYDAVGRYRTHEGEFPIDATGTLPGGVKFNGAAELKQVLKGKKDLFARCLAEKLLTYAIGRGVEAHDKRALDRIVANLQSNDYRISALVAGIVASDPFRLRRGKDENP